MTVRDKQLILTPDFPAVRSDVEHSTISNLMDPLIASSDRTQPTRAGQDRTAECPFRVRHRPCERHAEFVRSLVMDMAQHTTRTVTESARFALAQWSDRLGVAGMEAMSLRPGLAAAVDQHVARIRDTLGEPGPEALAAYADGVADTVTARGWSADEVRAGWHRASWPTLHLLAVCVLAESAT